MSLPVRAWVGRAHPCEDAKTPVPYATNEHDGTRLYFEDEGGDGAPVVLHDGFGDSVRDLRQWRIAEAIATAGFRLIYVDHRGHGRSDKPHDPGAYAISLRVADAVAVLDRLEIGRAHFIGRSWGGRLGFGIGAHAPERALALVIGGNQPYAWPDTRLGRVIGAALATGAERDSMEPLVRAFEDFWGIQFPDVQRTRLLDNDPVALQAAWTAAQREGAISNDLPRWDIRCLIFIGAADADFLAGARRAAQEIPRAELVVLEAADHYAAHLSQDDLLLGAVLRTLRGYDAFS
jgi:pimeloyl-ACP methyl ester carboxylesterase